MYRQQQHRPLQQRRHQRQRDDRNVYRKNEARRFADVGVYAPALANGRDDAGKTVVQQHQISRFAGHVSAALTHGNTDVGRLQRGRVVDAVTRHGHHLARCAQQLHQAQLVRRLQPGAQINMPQPLAQG